MSDAVTAPAPAQKLPWITALFDRFWGLFLVKRSYSIGVEYKPLAEKGKIKVAAELDYRKYFWDWRIGTRPVLATKSWGAQQMAGDPLAVAIVTEVTAVEGRFLRSEIDRMQRVLERNLTDRLSWVGVRVLGLRLHQYGTAAVEEKKK